MVVGNSLLAQQFELVSAQYQDPFTKTFSASHIITVTEDTYAAKLSKSNLAIFPNPANQLLVVESQDLPLMRIQFFDLSGRLMQEQLVYSNVSTIDISTWQNGTYMLHAQKSDGSTNIERVVVLNR